MLHTAHLAIRCWYFGGGGESEKMLTFIGLWLKTFQFFIVHNYGWEKLKLSRKGSAQNLIFKLHSGSTQFSLKLNLDIKIKKESAASGILITE